MAQPRIFPPTSVVEFLNDLATLDDARFEMLKQEIESELAFDSRSERCDEIARRIDIDRDSIGYLFSFLEFLYNRLNLQGATERVRSEMIRGLVRSTLQRDGSESDVAELLQQRLLLLTSPNENADIRRKVERLQKGFLPIAVGFSTFVDLRPMFSDDRSSMLRYVPVIQLRIATEQNDEESSVTVQLDPSGLAKLSDAISDAKKKLSLVGTDDFFATRIVNR